MSKDLHKKYRGIIPPVLTPFKQDKSLDIPVLEKFIDWLCGQKVDILFPMGGSGEYQTLTVEERKEIIDCVVNAEKKGADGVGVVIPTDIPGTEDAIFEYYRAVDEELSIPFMVYDPRGEGDHSATPALMRRMIDGFKNLVAIKYRTVNGESMGYMAREIAGDISLFSGAETVFLQDLSVGAVGCVGGGANFYPHLIWELQDRFEKNDLLGARQIQYRILEATTVLNRVYWPLSGKIILQELGFPFQLVTRVPTRPFTQEDVEHIREYYRKLLKIA